MKADQELGRHCFLVDPKEPGMHSLTLLTRFISNGDEIDDTNGVFLNQELSLQSNCNSASLSLFAAIFTPDRLRKLADEMEQKEVEIRTKYMMEKAAQA